MEVRRSLLVHGNVTLEDAAALYSEVISVGRESMSMYGLRAVEKDGRAELVSNRKGIVSMRGVESSRGVSASLGSMQAYKLSRFCELPMGLQLTVPFVAEREITVRNVGDFYAVELVTGWGLDGRRFRRDVGGLLRDLGFIVLH